jgi:hypothetical protein
MASLVGIPHKEGLEILKNELFERIRKFELLNDKKQPYYAGNLHSVFFDSNGVLTAIAVIPVEEHFTEWNKWVRVRADTGEIICEIETPAIQFVKGVGGEQVIKIAVSGEAGSVAFKRDDYVTSAEIEQLIAVVASMWMQNAIIQKALLKEELNSIKE